MCNRTALLLILLAALTSQARATNAGWVELRSDHFTVLTDSNEKQGRHILDQFERMRWVFHTLFPKANVDPVSPIIVLAVKDKKGFQALEPEAYLAKGQLQLAGLFLSAPDKNYVLLRLDAEGDHPFATIYHEYTHLQLTKGAEWMPLWLNEGLAEFYQNTEIFDKEVRVGEPSADDIMYLRQNQLLPLTTLLKVDATSPYYHEEQKGSVFYAESWALTHYLEITDFDTKTHRLSDYLDLVSRHEDPVAAAQKAFGDLNQLQKTLNAYVAQGSFKQFRLSSAAAPLDETSVKVRPLTQPQADAVRADFLAFNQRTKDARALLDAVLKADPQNVQAHETMGFLEFQEGNRETARKWYEQAVKLDSQSYLAHYYFAAMSMGAADTDRDEQIESSLRTAIKLNPAFAPAYDELAKFYGMRMQKLDDAHMLTLQAIQLEPGNLYYRIDAANVLISMTRFSDAEAVLRNAEGLARSPGESSMVQSRIRQIEGIQTMHANQEKAQADAATNEHPVTLVNGQVVIGDDSGPKHPDETATGPKHVLEGIIQNVRCSYPSVLEFQVQSAGKAGTKTVSVYSNNYFKIPFTATGFTQHGDLHPCTHLAGKKAQVRYAESSDKTVDGQVVSIDLRK
jgi:Tfp pilus assembly protein PilF